MKMTRWGTPYNIKIYMDFKDLKSYWVKCTLLSMFGNEVDCVAAECRVRGLQFRRCRDCEPDWGYAEPVWAHGGDHEEAELPLSQPTGQRLGTKCLIVIL